MKKAQFSKLIEGVSALTIGQLAKLLDAVESTKAERGSLQAIERAHPLSCGHCHSVHVAGNGNRNGLQRVICRDCGKSSNATTGTPISRLRHKEKFEQYAKCLKAKMSLREAAKATGVCLDTAFRWRHLFLKEVQQHQPSEVIGLLEVDETYFRESQKGSRKMTRPSRARGGKAKGRGRTSKDWVPVLVGRVRGQPYTTDRVLAKVNGAEVTDALKSVVKPGETVLCTDGHSAFLHLQRTLGVTTKSFIASYACPGLDKVYHVQSANSYHERLKTWIQRGLRGVSTKYLPSYLAWMRLSTWDKDCVSTDNIIASAMGIQIINL